MGTGTKVEVFADGVWQKLEMAGASGYHEPGRRQNFLPAWAVRITRTWCGSCGRRVCRRMKLKWHNKE